MKRSRSLGSAHTGMLSWLLQRASALYMTGFVIYVIAYLSLFPIHDHAAWKSWFATGPVRLAWMIFILGILIHAWIGMRSIYLDYLPVIWLRLSVSFVTVLGLLALGLWAAQILLMVNS
jgi:succinate dehydrogenase / fumarate reductase membrane anchor subunit